MHSRGIIGLLLVLGILTAVAPIAQAADAPTPEQAAVDQTPPRLSYVDGQVSFWRPGAQDWAQAQINTPLAPGDQLSTGTPGNLEIQIGLENQEPDFVQFKVTAGSAAFDLRGLERGQMVEVDTPNAAFTIEQPGYYRVEVAGERTSFVTRRTGRATLIPASGEAVAIAPSEEVVITGTASPQVASYVAPKFDDWDKWNYVYRNSDVRNAVVVVNENRFGRGPITAARVAQVDARSLQLIHTAPQIAPTPASFVPTATRGIRPPEASLKRPVVATRPPRRQEESASGAERPGGPAGIPAPAPRLVTAPQQNEPATVLPRPPFGQGSVERPPAARVQPPAAAQTQAGPQRPEKGAESVPPVTREAPPVERKGSPGPAPQRRAPEDAPRERPSGR